MKKILFLTLLVLLLSLNNYISAVTSEDIKDYWVDKNISEEEATLISKGEVTDTIESKVIKEIENQEMNVTEKIDYLIDKDIQGYILLSIIGLMILAMFVFFVVVFIGYGEGSL